MNNSGPRTAMPIFRIISHPVLRTVVTDTTLVLLQAGPKDQCGNVSRTGLYFKLAMLVLRTTVLTIVVLVVAAQSWYTTRTRLEMPLWSWAMLCRLHRPAGCGGGHSERSVTIVMICINQQVRDLKRFMYPTHKYNCIMWDWSQEIPWYRRA